MSKAIRDNNTCIGGFHAVVAALEQRRPVLEVRLAAHRRDARSNKVAAMARAAGVPVHTADMTALDDMLPDVRHQGCIATLVETTERRESELPTVLAAADDPWVLALDQVQDPHNLGACLRSAAAAGVSAVIAPRKRAAGLSPAVRKVAVGAIERVPFVPVTNLTRALKRLQEDGFWTVGLSGRADRSLYDVSLAGPVVVVLGGEAGGLRARTADTCDFLASIPMHNAMESLNVSVATGVSLFEAVRQRR